MGNDPEAIGAESADSGEPAEEPAEEAAEEAAEEEVPSQCKAAHSLVSSRNIASSSYCESRPSLAYGTASSATTSKRHPFFHPIKCT